VAAPSAQLRAGRYFGALLALVAVLYAIVFLSGASKAPRLGLDLRGGTTVTLTAQTDTGAAPSRERRSSSVRRRCCGSGRCSRDRSR
jgi:preprotein translocase subunit SecD